jgi:hypothetical protein
MRTACLESLAFNRGSPGRLTAYQESPPLLEDLVALTQESCS